MMDLGDITASVGSRPGWMDEGRCSSPSFDPTDFFLEGRWPKGSDPYNKAKARAKAVCDICPVKRECLQHALVLDIRDGIWGGHTYSERRKIKYPKQEAPLTPASITPTLEVRAEMDRLAS